MSHSILKRCLQLVEDDLPQCSSSKPSKQNIQKKAKKNHTIFDLIPEQKRLTITTKAGKNGTAKRKYIAMALSLVEMKSIFIQFFSHFHGHLR